MSLVIPTSRDIEKLVDVLEQIRDIDQQRLQLARYDHWAVGFIFNVVINGKTQKGVTMLQLTDIQKCDLSVQPVDAKGNPAPVDGAPVWTVSDETILAVTATADGMGATITAKGPLGTCQVNVTADADLGTGVTNITGTLAVTVVSSQAVSLNIGTGTPTNQ